MSRTSGFLTLIGIIVLAYMLVGGLQIEGGAALDVATAQSGYDGENDASQSIRSGILGLIAGYVLANLLQVSWRDIPGLVASWLRFVMRRFMIFSLGCLFGGILLFY